jgi:hypothetical protein
MGLVTSGLGPDMVCKPLLGPRWSRPYIQMNLKIYKCIEVMVNIMKSGTFAQNMAIPMSCLQQMPQ